MHRKGFVLTLTTLATLLITGNAFALQCEPFEKPGVALTSPLGGTHSPGARGNVKLTAAAFLADRVEFFIDGVLVKTDFSSPYSFAWPAKSGSHQYYARAVNLCGSDTSSTITFTVDCGLPTVTLTAPTHGSTVSPGSTGKVKLIADASHRTGISKVALYVDGINFQTDANGPPWARNWLATNGSHQGFAVAFSVCGSSRASFANTFTVVD